MGTSWLRFGTLSADSGSTRPSFLAMTAPWSAMSHTSIWGLSFCARSFARVSKVSDWTWLTFALYRFSKGSMMNCVQYRAKVPP